MKAVITSIMSQDKAEIVSAALILLHCSLQDPSDHHECDVYYKEYIRDKSMQPCLLTHNNIISKMTQ